MNNTSQHQYIANWHDSFVNYIESLLGVVVELMARPRASEKDKKGLDNIKNILYSRDVLEVEQDLAAGVVKRSTLDKVEKLNKDLADTCLEHIEMKPLVREFWRQMAYIQIEYNKQAELIRLDALGVSILEG